MKVKIKKLHENATIPVYATTGDAGLDLTATSMCNYRHDTVNYIEYGTGLAVEIPEGYVGLIFPRSSLSKTNLVLANHVGVIDSSYRGEIKFRFKDLHQYSNHSISPPEWYRVGDKIGQLIVLPYPYIEFEEVENLTETARGEGGFGSTGK
jgi:dUTP pyrophosphatase